MNNNIQTWQYTNFYKQCKIPFPLKPLLYQFHLTIITCIHEDRVPERKHKRHKFAEHVTGDRFGRKIMKIRHNRYQINYTGVLKDILHKFNNSFEEFEDITV